MIAAVGRGPGGEQRDDAHADDPARGPQGGYVFRVHRDQRRRYAGAATDGSEKLKPERGCFSARHTAPVPVRYGLFGAQVNAARSSDAGQGAQ